MSFPSSFRVLHVNLVLIIVHYLLLEILLNDGCEELPFQKERSTIYILEIIIIFKRPKSKESFMPITFTRETLASEGF